ncbi:MAG: methyltransferase domain-containing protein, partial [Sphaerospermopsis sp. SIO1G2]|nr:methyltransferase domain-containing protein [Sphaerospermopsis sp. SIO1G2]
QEEARLRRESPLIANDSVDLVLSNCVLNLVSPEDRQQLFHELYRVVKNGGRVAISDIVSDEDVPQDQQDDPELWSGCISGAFREDRFLQAFVDAGFYGVHLAKRDPKPWRVVDGIEYRAVTVVAYKGKEGPCKDAAQAVLYPGPWKEVHDDDGHVYKRGQRIAVCAKTYDILTRPPYADQLIPLPPYQPVSNLDDAPELCSGFQIRHPRITKNGAIPDHLPGGCLDDPDCCSDIASHPDQGPCLPGSGCC